MEAASLLIGRVPYEGFAAAWPERDTQVFPTDVVVHTYRAD
jgi:hypothetical protein